jgi:molybdate transport system substrate-binding protein
LPFLFALSVTRDGWQLYAAANYCRAPGGGDLSFTQQFMLPWNISFQAFGTERITMKSLLKFAAAAILLMATVPGRAAEKITVFAAVSLKDALEDAATAYQADTGNEVIVSLGASSALAKQIDAGAPADVFISADEKWMDWVNERKLVNPDTRKVIARNTLVIAVGKDSAAAGDAGAVLGTAKFAMGDPSNVPAGIYGQAALTSLGLWDGLKGNAVFAENVRAALAFVDKGEVPAAIVYGSDVYASKNVKSAFEFPETSHPPIVFPAAATAKANAAAVGFVEFLAGEKGQKALTDNGFLTAAK